MTLKIYKLTSGFPNKEQFGLVSQLNRAAVSVPSNIAEGVARSGVKEKRYFIEIAYGSLMEVACQLSISYDLGFVDQENYSNTRNEILRLIKMLSKLKSSF